MLRHPFHDINSRLLHVLGRLSFFLFLPVWIYSDMFSVLKHPAIVSLENEILINLIANAHRF